MYSEKELEKRAERQLEAKKRQELATARPEPNAAKSEDIKARQVRRKRA